MHEITKSLLRNAHNKIHPDLLLRIKALTQLAEFGELAGWDYDALQLYFDKHPACLGRFLGQAVGELGQRLGWANAD